MIRLPFYFISALFAVRLLRKQPALTQRPLEIRGRMMEELIKRASTERWMRRAMGRRRKAKEQLVGLSWELVGGQEKLVVQVRSWESEEYNLSVVEADTQKSDLLCENNDSLHLPNSTFPSIKCFILLLFLPYSSWLWRIRQLQRRRKG